MCVCVCVYQLHLSISISIYIPVIKQQGLCHRVSFRV